MEFYDSSEATLNSSKICSVSLVLNTHRSRILANLDNQRRRGCLPNNRPFLYETLNAIQASGSSSGRNYIVLIFTARRFQDEINTAQLGASLNNLNSASVSPYFFYGAEFGSFVYNTLTQNFRGRANALARQPLNRNSAELADTACSLITDRPAPTPPPTTPSPTSKFSVPEVCSCLSGYYSLSKEARTQCYHRDSQHTPATTDNKSH